MNWKALQNGPDIRGIAIEGIEGQEVNLTPEVATILGLAFSKWLSGKLKKKPENIKVSMGMDSRLSGPELSEAVISGLIKNGCYVYNTGLASTPAMYMSTKTEGFNFDAAIMLTASHMPFNRNGMKFFTKQGSFEKEDITELLSMAEKGEFSCPAKKGLTHQIDFMSVYANQLVNTIRNEAGSIHPLKEYKIVLDAGNGAGGFFADKVLQPLGADTKGSQFLEPDGFFPNHIPNPEDPRAMKSIQQAVKEHKADLGIIFDTDVDRAAIVDKTGQAINRNRLIALISSIILKKHPHTWIVTDSITSDGLTFFIQEKLGGFHHRFKRGYRNVINEAIRLNHEGKETHLAIETSGHAAIKENHFLDDGAFLVAQILIKLAKLRKKKKSMLPDLIKDMPGPKEEKEFRLKIKTPDFKSYGEKVIAELEKFTKTQAGWKIVPDNYEGIRVSCGKDHGNGWFLLRLSLHDPVIPINVESNETGGIRIMVEKLRKFLKRFDELGTSSIEGYLAG